MATVHPKSGFDTTQNLVDMLPASLGILVLDEGLEECGT